MHFIINKTQSKPFISIKSRNDCGEGNYMEPDLKYGHAWLDALQSEVIK